MPLIYQSEDAVNNKNNTLDSENINWFDKGNYYLEEKSVKETDFSNNLKTSSDNNNESIFSEIFNEFLTKYEKQIEHKKINVEGNINVSEVLGGLARLYEKIRTTVEYKSENLLRKNAIERILKRLLWERRSFGVSVELDRMAEHIIKELIWAKYIPNNTIAKVKIIELSKIIGKYIYINDNLDNFPHNYNLSKVKNWLLGVASSEIEDVLDPSNKELFIDLMYKWYDSHFEWKDDELDSHQKEVQLYLAIHRSFLKSDSSIMRYYLLRKEIIYWDNASEKDIDNFISQFPKIFSNIEGYIDYKGKQQLYRRMNKHSAAFEILKQLVVDNSENIKINLYDVEKTKNNIKNICRHKYKEINKKVNTGILRSIIYIFTTKVIFALLLEVPYEIIRFGDMKYIPFIINILLPPFLMFFIGLSIRMPGSKNTDLIINIIESILYKESENKKIIFSIKKQDGNSKLSKIFAFSYILLFIIVFGVISYVLNSIGFSIFGILVFFFFLSLVLLFAFRIRYQANLLRVEPEKEGILSHFVGYVTLPFLNLGFYLSRGLAQINIFTILLDFIIEAPLKNIIEMFEEWSGFMKRKKEDVIEISE